MTANTPHGTVNRGSALQLLGALTEPVDQALEALRKGALPEYVITHCLTIGRTQAPEDPVERVIWLSTWAILVGRALVPLAPDLRAPEPVERVIEILATWAGPGGTPLARAQRAATEAARPFLECCAGLDADRPVVELVYMVALALLAGRSAPAQEVTP